MSLLRYAKRRDDNEKEIIQALEAVGCTVIRIDTPVDLLVGRGGKTYLLEIKGKSGRLTPPQKRFFKKWKGHATIVTSVDDALSTLAFPPNA